MKRTLLPVIVTAMLLSVSCKHNKPAVQQDAPAFDNQLTADEKAGGVMTPEIMWKFGRLSGTSLSPDGSTLLYCVTQRDLATEAALTNIYSIPVSGGDATQLTREGGSSPQWIEGGNGVAFVDGDGDLSVMDPKGGSVKKVAGLSGFEYFS
ncbi:MAG TPA: hypothetical protein PKI12_07135, partial [Bacteroidales bacterium]|nr:hypothetical protein [Bacteroidales bacterium]